MHDYDHDDGSALVGDGKRVPTHARCRCCHSRARAKTKTRKIVASLFVLYLCASVVEFAALGLQGEVQV